MPKFLLDTDTCIYWLKGNEAIENKIRTAGLGNVCTSIITDHDFKPIISLKIFEDARFTSAVGKGFSFYRNVEREGISV